MSLRYDEQWTYRGFRALVLENEQVRVVVLPELGAKVWSIVYKPVDREMLWHHPRVPPRPAVYGATYDWFCGGWDDLFPCDTAVTIGDTTFPDHGELWAMPFAWTVEEATSQVVSVRLWRHGVATATTVEKRITLRADEPMVRFHHFMRNDGYTPIDFNWKLHPALRITPASRLDLPARRVVVDQDFRDRLGHDVATFTWPFAETSSGERVDMRQIPPPEAATTDLYYAPDIDEGWCALTDSAAQVGFGLVFDPAILNTVYIFAPYGGWRGLYTLLLEPTTGYPYQLDQAIATGRSYRLTPGATLVSEVSAVLYRGVRGVKCICPDGQVVGEQ